MYDYPGGYDDKAIGDRLTKVRQEAERIFEDRCTAGGYAPSLTPGFAIQRTSQDGNSQDDDYLILRCNHWYGDQSYASTASGQEAADGAYSGSYELSRFSVPYRMPLRTRRPVIIGSQPAKVISKQNQEIDVDKQGRVLVEFYWDDTTGSSAPRKTPSRRVRVGQIWAGLNRGALFIPRVGDEVMVEYENGDPDRPIIVGSVYNGTSENPGNLVSLTLPDKKTMSGVLGKSSTDGGSTIHNANAWWFDDAKGSEQFLVRARKDLYLSRLQQPEHSHRRKRNRDRRGRRDDQRRASRRRGGEGRRVERGRKLHPQRLPVDHTECWAERRAAAHADQDGSGRASR